MLAKMDEDVRKWDLHLSQVEFALNNSINRSIQDAPSRLVFGMTQIGTINDKLKEILSSITDQEPERDFYNLRNRAVEKIEKSQAYNKTYYDQTHRKPLEYKVGDLVSVPNIDVTVGVNKKLLPKFKGPYVITKRLPNDRYLISDLDEFKVPQKHFEGVFDASRLKLWSDSGDLRKWMLLM